MISTSTLSSPGDDFSIVYDSCARALSVQYARALTNDAMLAANTARLTMPHVIFYTVLTYPMSNEAQIPVHFYNLFKLMCPNIDHVISSFNNELSTAKRELCG